MKQLFEQKPYNWGLRGDPFLWDEMKNHLESYKLPNTEKELKAIFRRTFRKFTNEEIDSKKRIYIEKYAMGGMSSGIIDCDFWLKKILPTLIERFHTLPRQIVKIRHRFLDHPINPETETLILGTFNPETADNDAKFFYGRNRNYLWQLLPSAFGETNLKKASKNEKLEFIRKYKIDLIDLIEEIEIDAGQEANYDDGYIDSMVSKWRNIIALIDSLPNLKRVCFTRKTFSDIPNMKKQIDAIRQYCENKKIVFKALITPSRFYRDDKQTEWTNFLFNDSR